MPLRLPVKKKLVARSDRVKSVDLHPEQPWVLTAMYDGRVSVWDYEAQKNIKDIELCDVPLRCAKWIVRKQWIVTAGDNLEVVVVNYNTYDVVKRIPAHGDYIRSLAVHPV